MKKCKYNLLICHYYYLFYCLPFFFPYNNNNMIRVYIYLLSDKKTLKMIRTDPNS